MSIVSSNLNTKANQPIRALKVAIGMIRRMFLLHLQAFPAGSECEDKASPQYAGPREISSLINGYGSTYSNSLMFLI
jgi:hypothetical protein